MAQQDFFYNVLANPDFTSSDFKANNINVKNSTIQDKDFYLKNKAVIEDFTDDNGVFNKNAFENAYYTALEMYNTLAENTYEEDALKSATYSYNDIFAPPEQRRPESTPIINNLGDPIRYDGTQYRQYTQGIEGAFVTGKTDKSIEEIAQSQKVWDGSKWVESPEEDFFANLWDTRVKATWDFDADENGNPTNDQNKIAHFKGELKLNEDGLPYYENLNGRSLVGKEVLHLTDVLTNEDSALNTIDFFDSDDLHKNPAGTLMKTLVTIAPMLIPGVNNYYIGAGIALELAKLATLGTKLVAGTDVGVLNNFEGFLTKLETSPIKQESKSSWTLNNFINLAGDVYKQLAEQRWLFKYGTLLLSKGASSEAKMAKLQEETLERLNNSSKNSLTKLLDQGDIDNLTYLKRMKEYEIANSFAAQKSAQQSLQHWQKIGEEMSRIYMTGITVADSYNEVKAQGLSDTEAALYTAGYGLFEYLLLKSDIGKWVLPETKFDAYRINTALSKWGTAINSENVSKLVGETAKKASAISWIKKGWEASKLENRISPSVGFNLGKYAIGNAFAEGTEETTEELLADLSKSFFNAYAALTGSEKHLNAWENMLDRYSMSFAGGMLGGGLFSLNGELKTAYQAASEMSTSDAGREIMQFIRDGKKDELVKKIQKATWANPYISSDFEEIKGKGVLFKAGTKENNLNKSVQNILIGQLDILESVMKANGLDVSSNDIISSYLPDLKYAALMNSSQLAKYNQDFTAALNDATRKALDYNSYVTAEGKQASDNSDGNLRSNEETLKKKAQAKSDLDEALAKVEKFKNGEMSRDYILAGVFELNPQLKGMFITPTYRDWLELELKKDFKDITKQEYEEKKAKYNEYLRGSYKDDIMTANQILVKYLQKVSPELTKKLDLQNMSTQSASTLDTAIANMEESQMQGGKSSNNEIQLMLILLEQLDKEVSLKAPNIPTYQELLDKLKSSAEYENEIATLNSLSDYEQERNDKKVKYTEAQNKLQVARDTLALNFTAENEDAARQAEADEQQAAQEFNTANSKYQEVLEKVRQQAEGKAEQITKYLNAIDENTRTIDQFEQKIGQLQMDIARGSIDSLEIPDIVNMINALYQVNNAEELEAFKSTYKYLINKYTNIKEIVDYYEQILDGKQKIEQAHINLQQEISENVLDINRLREHFKLVLSDENYSKAAMNILNGGINPITRGYYAQLFETLGFDQNSTEYYNKIVRALTQEGSSNYIVPNDILEILDTIAVTLNGNTVSQLVQALNQEFFNQSNNIDQVNITGDIDTALEVIKIAQATLAAFSNTPTLTNLHGYSAVYNELFGSDEGAKELLTLDNSTVSKYIEKLEQIKSHLEYIKELSARNSNNKIKEQKDTSIQLNYLLYSEVERLRTLVDNDRDWKRIELLDKALEEGAKLKEKVQSEKEQELAKKNFELNLHKFLTANLDLLDDTEKFSKVFNLRNFKFGFVSKNTINRETTSLDARSFYFYLASVAALNPNDFYHLYKDKLDEHVGPFSLQEMQLFIATAKIVNKDVVNKFIKHYNYVIEHMTQEELQDPQIVGESSIDLKYIKDSTLYLQYDLPTFIEGVAGAGKTTAILNMLFKILGKDHPLFRKVIVASSSIENAKKIIDESIIDNARCEAYTKVSRKGRNDQILLDRVSPTHKDLVENKGDTQTLKSTTKIEIVDGIPTLIDDTVNKESDPPSLLIIDEAQLYSSFDMAIIIKYCKENNIELILLGDIQQTGVTGTSTYNDGTQDLTLVSALSRNQFFGGFKLGVTMRSQNKPLADSIEVLRQEVEGSKSATKIQVTYNETDTNIKGVKVLETEVGSFINKEGDTIDPDSQEFEDQIVSSLKKMKNSDGTYTIIVNSITEYQDIINTLKEKLGEASVEILEGVAFSGVTRDNVIILMDDTETESGKRRLYTAVSRAQQGAILVTQGNIISNPVKSAPDSGYNASDIKRVYEERKKILDEVYPTGNSIMTPTGSAPSPAPTGPTGGPTAPTGTPPVTPPTTPPTTPPAGPTSTSGGTTPPSTLPPSTPPTTPPTTPTPAPPTTPPVTPPVTPPAGGSTPPIQDNVQLNQEEEQTSIVKPPIMKLNQGFTNGYTFISGYIDPKDSDANDRIDGVIGIAKILGKNPNDVEDMFIDVRKAVIYGKNASDVSRKVEIILSLNKDSILLKSIGLKVYSNTPTDGALYKQSNTELDPTVKATIDKNIVAIFEVDINGEKKLLEIPLCRPASIITYMENHPTLARNLGFNINVNKKDLFDHVNDIIIKPLLAKTTTLSKEEADALALAKIFIANNPYYYQIYSSTGQGKPINDFFNKQTQQVRRPYIRTQNIMASINQELTYIKSNNQDFFKNPLIRKLPPRFFHEDVTLCGTLIPKGTPVIIYTDKAPAAVSDATILSLAKSNRVEDYEGINVLILNQPSMSVEQYLEYLVTRNGNKKFNSDIGNQLTNLRLAIPLLQYLAQDSSRKSLAPEMVDALPEIENFFKTYYEFNNGAWVKKEGYTYRDIVNSLKTQSWYNAKHPLSSFTYFNSLFHKVHSGSNLSALNIVYNDNNIRSGLISAIQPYFPNGVYLNLLPSSTTLGDSTEFRLIPDAGGGFSYIADIPETGSYPISIDTSVKVLTTNIVLDLNDTSDSMAVSYKGGSVRVYSNNPVGYPSLKSNNKYSKITENIEELKDIIADSDQDFINQCAQKGYIIVKVGKSLTCVNPKNPIKEFQLDFGNDEKLTPKIPEKGQCGRAFKITQGNEVGILFIHNNSGDFTYDVVSRNSLEKYSELMPFLDYIFSQSNLELTSAIHKLCSALNDDTDYTDAQMLELLEGTINNTPSGKFATLKENFDNVLSVFDASAKAAKELSQSTQEENQTPQKESEEENEECAIVLKEEDSATSINLGDYDESNMGEGDF